MDANPANRVAAHLCHPSLAQGFSIPSCFNLLFTMAAVDLKGLWREWESVQEIRHFVRAKRTLFAPALRSLDVKANVPCAERNILILEPIVKRLKLRDGTLGQVRVPDVARESFDSILSQCC